MHPMEALWSAEHLEQLVGVTGPRVRATCYPVPLRPGFDRRRTRWLYLLSTDADERALRDVLASYRVEYIQRRGPEHVYVLWPGDQDPRRTV